MEEEAIGALFGGSLTASFFSLSPSFAVSEEKKL